MQKRQEVLKMAADRGVGAQPALMNTEENRLKVLTYIAGCGREARVEPVVSSVARIGYHYPELCEVLACKPGEEFDILESLAEVGCLSREIHDKVDLCPFCLHTNLRLRRLCPYCRSSLIVKKEVLHHFRCGWVGIEDEARHGTDLVCPKCNKHLRHIGVDYERASESYYCTTCKKIFAQPIEEFLSVPCGRQIAKDGTMMQPIFVYALTPVGVEAASKQSFDGIPLQKGIIEGDFNLYTWGYMERRLAELVNRYLRYRAGFSILLISVDQFPGWVADEGHVVASNLVKVMASVLRGESRGVDLPGLFDEHTFSLLLPQTNCRGAEIFANRYMERIKDVNDPHIEGVPTVSIAIAGCPEDGEDAETLVTTLTTRLERCVTGGGNTIKGPAPEGI
jgi:diguanylate cyclase (GGDEF)-like protein